MAYVVFIVGMAGSGKSSLTAAYSEWLKEGDQDVIVANFDPGATALPYNPDIDARQYVDLEKLMLDYKLGPNGALVMASDLLADHLEEIREEIDAANPDIVLADTPGRSSSSLSEKEDDSWRSNSPKTSVRSCTCWMRPSVVPL